MTRVNLSFNRKMITHTFTLLLMWLFEPCISVDSYITNLAIKKNMHASTDTTALTATTFTDLVKDSKILIDNTLIIKELLAGNYERTVLLCPGKWGRTTILTMLKAFLEIAVDEKGYKVKDKKKTENYELFVYSETKFNKVKQKLESSLLISKEKDLINSFLGEFPVIYVTFNDTKGENFTAVKDKIGHAISRAFREHVYLGTVLAADRNEDLQKFRHYLLYNGSQIIEDGIPFLCRLLHRHFQKRVFILMDDYDKPLHSYLQVDSFEKKEFKELLQFMELIMEKAFEHEEEIRKGIIVGEFEPGRSMNTTWKNYTKIYISYDKTPLREFFGLNKKHVEYFYKHHKIQYKQSQMAKRWYDGHESMFSDDHFYTSYSVLKYLKEKKLQPYLIEAGEQKDFIQKVIERDVSFAIRNTILRLMSKHHLQLLDERMEMNDFTMVFLKNLLFNSPENNIEGEEFFYSYLFRKGYLTKIRHSEKTNEDQFISVKLVNNEAAHILAESMVTYYVHDFNIDPRNLRHAGNALRDFVANEKSTDTRNLEEALTALYNNASAKIPDHLLDPEQEDYLHSIFHAATLQMQIAKKFEIEVFYNRSVNADIVIIDQINSQGLAIELTSHQWSADAAFETVQSYTDLFKNFHNIYKTHVAGINLSPNKTVQILTKSIGPKVV